MPKTITQLTAAASADPSAVVAADNAAGTLTEKVTLQQIADLASPTPTTWQGEWDYSATYAVGDFVYYNNVLYICVNGNSNPTPGTDPNYWAEAVAGGTSFGSGNNNGDVLTWDSGSSTWGPAAPAGGGADYNWQGYWNYNTQYAVNDAVIWSGAMYALHTDPGFYGYQPDSYTQFWKLIGQFAPGFNATWTPNDGDVLAWSSSEQQWIPSASGGGGGGLPSPSASVPVIPVWDYMSNQWVTNDTYGSAALAYDPNNSNQIAAYSSGGGASYDSPRLIFSRNYGFDTGEMTLGSSGFEFYGAGGYGMNYACRIAPGEFVTLDSFGNQQTKLWYGGVDFPDLTTLSSGDPGQWNFGNVPTSDPSNYGSLYIDSGYLRVSGF